MRILRMFLLFSAILSASVVGLAQNSSTSGTQPAMLLAISAEQNSVNVGTPVRVKVILTNKSGHDVTFSRPGDGYDCRLDVRDINGKLAPDTKFGYLRSSHDTKPDEFVISPDDLKGRLVVVTVKAGETLTWEEDAAKLYDMTQPGKYAVQGQMQDPTNPSEALKSNTITVTVTP